MNVLLSQVMFGLGQALWVVLTSYLYIVVIAALLTWVNPDPHNPIVRFLYAATEPALARVRRFFPFVSSGTIDFSPLVLIAVIIFLRIALVGSLFRLGSQIGLAPGWHGVG